MVWCIGFCALALAFAFGFVVSGFGEWLLAFGFGALALALGFGLWFVVWGL